jgi:hypothetical protein
MQTKGFSTKVAALALAAAFAGSFAPGSAAAGDRGKRGRDGVKTVTVTVEDKDRTVPTIDPRDFAVFRGDERQQIVDVKGPGQTPVNIAVLIQDGLTDSVGHELGVIKDFIRTLPDGSNVMVGYLRGTHFERVQPFTTDRELAAKAIRLPISSGGVGSAPFQNMVAAIDAFDGVAGRNQIVLVSSGLELNRGFDSAAPTRNIDLDRAISHAQDRGIPVWSIFANASGQLGRSRTAINYGQGSLNRLSDETGGKAFFTGSSFVTFDAALDKITRGLDNQYVIAYRDSGRGKLDVTVESSGIDVRHSR